MYKLFITGLLLFPFAIHALDAEQLLKAADEYRQSGEEILVRSVIKLYKDNELERERAYDVYIRPDRQSLVISKTPSEKGQKVLMLDDKFWLLLPKSKRPIRITPMQKLIGEASTGDIATMKWHEDYAPEIVTTSQPSNNQENNDEIALLLTAKHKGATYQKIHLWIAEHSYIPKRAELFLTSGKLAKIARFEVNQVNGREQVTKMILHDNINRQQHTEITYIENKAFSIDQKYFNPTYLARNPAFEI